MKKIALLSLAASTLLLAGGYKVPELSMNSTALSAAYVANPHTADAAYFNPANMVFMDDGQHVEQVLTYIRLSEQTFTGTVPNPDGSLNSDGAVSASEDFFSPSLHYVSPMFGDTRFGLSIVAPAGLTKRWEEQPAMTYANKFSLLVVELNPSVAYKVSENFSIAGGARLVYSEGIVMSASLASRNMEGDSFDFGYNLALSYRPMPELKLAATYRSNVDLTEEGSATIYFPDSGDYSGNVHYSGGATVSVPVPATLNLAVAYTFDTDTTVEFVYERAMWSSYETLDFNYESSLGPLDPKFADPIAKDWSDVSAYRIGVTQEYDGWTGMAGIAYDESPVPQESLNFELADSDGIIVSFGGRYAYSETVSLGASLLVDFKESRTVSGAINDSHINGEFTDARAYLLSLGAEIKF
ncbi:MAG: outer membrane protein transport protein [Campylobacterota bacterium]|nr:outer membrane protein transport protein [Campylobacterota bacterium]